MITPWRVAWLRTRSEPAIRPATPSMPTLEENRRLWREVYAWQDGGDEWSAAWGGPEFQWAVTVLPRIQRFLPAGLVVEIGCGFGRWTRFLKDHCERLVAVDLSDRCIEACRKRFAADPGMRFVLTDGTTLGQVAAGSVDLVFSFDSLVHADCAVLEAYLEEIATVLKPEGAAFIHHSNVGEYREVLDGIRSVQGLEAELQRLGCWDDSLHLRDPGPSARWLARTAQTKGLRCITQELVPWGLGRLFIDAFSTLVRADSSHPRHNQVIHNDAFVQEIEHASRLARWYGKDRKD